MARSARATCRQRASSLEWMATASQPWAAAARRMRTAISPRLATSSRFTTRGSRGGRRCAKGGCRRTRAASPPCPPEADVLVLDAVEGRRASLRDTAAEAAEPAQLEGEPELQL